MRGMLPVWLVVSFVYLLLPSWICAADEIVVVPNSIELSSPHDWQRVIVQRTDGETMHGQIHEKVEWTSSDQSIAKIADGQVIPVADGDATITAKWNGKTAAATVKVRGQANDHPFSFRNDVLPILSKRDCNSGGCHGALAGKGGFRLSLQGYDPESDYFNIVKQDRGRRTELSAPEYSLLLNKPSGIVPHKGGLKLEQGSDDFQVVAKWISQGASPPEKDDRYVERLEIFPEASLQKVGDQQDFLVRAIYSDGSKRDVTHWTKWSSTNDTVCQVSEQGIATVMGPGEGAIVAWYDSKLSIARTTVPYTAVKDQEALALADQRKPRNFIDEHVNAKLIQLNLVASGNCTDLQFLRRAYIDTVGRLPTADEARQFMVNSKEDKRDQLIERLLNSPEFVDYWSYKWSDMLMLNGTLLRPEPLKAYYQWLHGHVEKNTPWDQMVREVITATGESTENGATNFYALFQTPEDMTENASQAFMSLSISCAKCHNHPLEKWTNDQYYSMANIFARVKAKGWGGETRNGDGKRTLYVTTTGDLVQPRTGKPQPPTPLDGDPMPIDDPTDRRIAFAKWLTSPDNPYFAKAITNRVWANYFGVGLVEEVDDLRVSNPASNAELFDAATQHVVDNKFDLKSLMRAILQSNAYQRSSESVAGNQAETRFYSRYYPRRLMAEVAHDAVVQATGVDSKFDKIAFPGNDKQDTKFYPAGTRAIELYDSAVENYFLDAFGRNPRNIVCECERSSEPTMVQVLHISNGNTINDKLKSADSRVETLLRLRHSGYSSESILDEIYLTCLSRFPTTQERESLVDLIPSVGASGEREVIEDLFWGLMSTREFLFNH